VAVGVAAEVGVGVPPALRARGGQVEAGEEVALKALELGGGRPQPVEERRVLAPEPAHAVSIAPPSKRMMASRISAGIREGRPP
jgi:hypothetical protein